MPTCSAEIEMATKPAPVAYDAEGLRLLATIDEEAALQAAVWMLGAKTPQKVETALQVIRDAGLDPWDVAFAGTPSIREKLQPLGVDPEIANYLDASEGSRRLWGIRELGKRRLEHLPLLKKIATSRISAIREALAEALGSLGPATLPLLKRLANKDEEDTFVRLAAAKSLGNHGPKAIKTLETLRKDLSFVVRTEANVALERIQVGLANRPAGLAKCAYTVLRTSRDAVV